MELGLIGLGRMGGNMAQRLVRGGHRVVVFDQNAEAVAASQGQGAEGAASLEDLVGGLAAPRAVWVMVPAGEATEATIDQLIARLSPGDTVLDGGNANYRDSMRRGEKLAEHGLGFMDVGTSGGIWGLVEGYSLMIGGSPRTSGGWNQFFKRWPQGKTGATATLVRWGPDISLRWCTTGWSTG